ASKTKKNPLLGSRCQHLRNSIRNSSKIPSVGCLSMRVYSDPIGYSKGPDCSIKFGLLRGCTEAPIGNYRAQWLLWPESHDIPWSRPFTGSLPGVHGRDQFCINPMQPGREAHGVLTQRFFAYDSVLKVALPDLLGGVAHQNILDSSLA